MKTYTKTTSPLALITFIFSISLLTACASFQTPANPFIGQWDLTMDSPMGKSASTLIITPELTGTMTLAQLGQVDISNAKVEGNNASFSMTISAMGQQIEATFGGVIEGDNINGTLNTSFGPSTITGVRVASSE